jgi:hypothetical protein
MYAAAGATGAYGRAGPTGMYAAAGATGAYGGAGPLGMYAAAGATGVYGGAGATGTLGAARARARSARPGPLARTAGRGGAGLKKGKLFLFTQYYCIAASASR